MAKLQCLVAKNKWQCSACSTIYENNEVSKAWQNKFYPRIVNVEKDNNAQYFTPIHCQECGETWTEWEIIESNEENHSYLKCKETRCPDNRNGFCTMGNKPPVLIVKESKSNG